MDSLQGPPPHEQPTPALAPIPIMSNSGTESMIPIYRTGWTPGNLGSSPSTQSWTSLPPFNITFPQHFDIFSTSGSSDSRHVITANLGDISQARGPPRVQDVTHLLTDGVNARVGTSTGHHGRHSESAEARAGRTAGRSNVRPQSESRMRARSWTKARADLQLLDPSADAIARRNMLRRHYACTEFLDFDVPDEETGMYTKKQLHLHIRAYRRIIIKYEEVPEERSAQLEAILDDTEGVQSQLVRASTDLGQARADQAADRERHQAELRRRQDYQTRLETARDEEANKAHRLEEQVTRLQRSTQDAVDRRVEAVNIKTVLEREIEELKKLPQTEKDRVSSGEMALSNARADAQGAHDAARREHDRANNLYADNLRLKSGMMTDDMSSDMVVNLQNEMQWHKNALARANDTIRDQVAIIEALKTSQGMDAGLPPTVTRTTEPVDLGAGVGTIGGGLSSTQAQSGAPTPAGLGAVPTVDLTGSYPAPQRSPAPAPTGTMSAPNHPMESGARGGTTSRRIPINSVPSSSPHGNVSTQDMFAMFQGLQEAVTKAHTEGTATLVKQMMDSLPTKSSRPDPSIDSVLKGQESRSLPAVPGRASSDKSPLQRIHEVRRWMDQVESVLSLMVPQYNFGHDYWEWVCDCAHAEHRRPIDLLPVERASFRMNVHVPNRCQAMESRVRPLLFLAVHVSDQSIATARKISEDAYGSAIALVVLTLDRAYKGTTAEKTSMMDESLSPIMPRNPADSLASLVGWKMNMEVADAYGQLSTNYAYMTEQLLKLMEPVDALDPQGAWDRRFRISQDRIHAIGNGDWERFDAFMTFCEGQLNGIAACRDSKALHTARVADIVGAPGDTGQGDTPTVAYAVHGMGCTPTTCVCPGRGDRQLCRDFSEGGRGCERGSSCRYWHCKEPSARPSGKKICYECGLGNHFADNCVKVPAHLKLFFGRNKNGKGKGGKGKGGKSGKDQPSSTPGPRTANPKRKSFMDRLTDRVTARLATTEGTTDSPAPPAAS